MSSEAAACESPARQCPGEKSGRDRVPPGTPQDCDIQRRKSSPTNGKGRDIGYALAANSCEGVNSVESCTITALDAITAFAVPNPSYILAEQPVFSGRVVLQVALADAITQLTLDWLNFHLRQPFQPSTREKVNAPTQIVNAVFWCSAVAFPVHSVDRIRLRRARLQS
jgi:hypothetical protein